jgi:hypothetical protein
MDNRAGPVVPAPLRLTGTGELVGEGEALTNAVVLLEPTKVGDELIVLVQLVTVPVEVVVRVAF